MNQIIAGLILIAVFVGFMAFMMIGAVVSEMFSGDDHGSMTEYKRPK